MLFSTSRETFKNIFQVCLLVLKILSFYLFVVDYNNSIRLICVLCFQIFVNLPLFVYFAYQTELILFLSYRPVTPARAIIVDGEKAEPVVSKPPRSTIEGMITIKLSGA